MREQGHTNQATNSGDGSEEKDINYSKQGQNSTDNSIRAADSSRNDERDQRIGKEPDTKRLRSEKESVEKGKSEE
jgi:hypothetical protein